MKDLKYKSLKNIDRSKINDYLKICKFISENLSDSESESWNLGYELFGPFLVGFCEWLHNKVNENNGERIFFMARDGYIIRKIYNILYPDEDTSYLYVSRKSLVLPSIKLTDTSEEILNKLVVPPSFTILELLKCFNLSIDECKKEIENIGINEDELFYRDKFKSDERLNKVIQKLRKLIDNKVANQKNNFLNYLKQEKFEGNIAIVDVGWHNSIQNLLQNIINNEKLDVTLNGYYVGVYDNAIKFNTGSSNGYLFEYNQRHEIQYKTFAFVSLFELMFLAHEGTTIGYEKYNDKYTAELAEYEYKNKEKMLKVISDFQKGASQFVKDYCSDNEIKECKIGLDIAQANILNFGINPKKEDIAIFENLIFENFTYNNLVNFNHSNLYYYTHPKTAKNDFYKSGWRIVFFKKLIPFPFPHYYMFKLLCRIFL